VRLKIRSDDAGRFPRARPVWRFHPEWSAEHANSAKSGVKENRVGDREDSEVRAGVPDRVWKGVCLGAHDLLHSIAADALLLVPGKKYASFPQSFYY
jgi:hypothetical protein